MTDIDNHSVENKTRKTIGKEERDKIRKLMSKGTFDRQTNLVLNNLLMMDELYDDLELESGFFRNYAKGIALGSQAEANEKLISLKIRNEQLKSITFIIAIISIIVTVVSIMVTLISLVI